MWTTVDLDDGLLAEAQRLTGTAALEHRAERQRGERRVQAVR